MKEKLQIELLRAAVSEIKLFSEFSSNDHTESYITVLIERSGIATVAEKAENRSDADELISRRNDISLQDTATITAAARDVEEEEDMIIRVILLQLIDTAVFIFNLAFLTVMKTTVTS
ncbi:hypothetical protein BDBG_08144 [Blastomyces gilchristii SLH14081]|uniref:Uncharacterized protein n=1 Tax=Blastomyces gilchristii (strain SLH14081) TaxID=559298 RepID=A0A179V0K6_BLAGS|nr:uncharacterized protein BDBG_08144 [Blastomyces gilchristii SLH14081]OAT12851.1 hypothetical protein BDBG_08144 [Blastomyces gilchristii SLH14081]